MKIPFIKYVESMVVARKTLPQILRDLESHSLRLPDQAAAIIYEQLRKVYPSYFEDVKEVAQPDWLQELKIDKMYSYLTHLEVPRGTLGIEGAFKILEDAPMYQLITALALARITDEDIELLVNGKFNVQYSPEDIKEFLHYFFNVDGWTLNDRKMFVGNVQDPRLKMAYKIALDKPKDYLVWKLGASPDKTFDEMLEDMTRDAYYNFKEWARDNPDIAQKWGALAVRMMERLDKVQRDKKDKADFFDEITFKIQTIREKDGIYLSKEPEKKHISQLNNDA